MYFTVSKNDQYALLALASAEGHTEIVKLLLQSGTKAAVAASDGRTPLNTASLHGHLEVAKLLLDRRTDLIVSHKEGWTLFHFASQRTSPPNLLVLVILF